MRHHALNELVARALSAAAIPNTKEPQGLCRSDGKRRRLTLVPWQSGKSLVWDVTVVCPLTDSYVASAAREAGSVAEHATVKKINKYNISMTAEFHFQPIAVETFGPINESICDKKDQSATSGRRLFYFNVCPSWCNDSTACYSTTPSFATTVRSNGH